jgi:hypothetical protein
MRKMEKSRGREGLSKKPNPHPRMTDVEPLLNDAGAKHKSSNMGVYNVKIWEWRQVGKITDNCKLLSWYPEISMESTIAPFLIYSCKLSSLDLLK